MSTTNADNKTLTFTSSDYLKHFIESGNLSADKIEKAESDLYTEESGSTEARFHNPLALRLLSFDTNSSRQLQRSTHQQAEALILSEVNDPPDQALVQDQLSHLLKDENFGSLYNDVMSAETPQALKDAESRLKEYMEAHYPDLRELVVDRMGYGNFVGFLQGALAHDEAWLDPDTRKQLNENFVVDMLSKRLDLPYGEGSVAASVDETGKLPDVNPEAAFVEFTLTDGSKITFDGPEAGRAANEFAKIYNNSETFRETMHHLAQKQGGIYGFHVYEQAATEKGMVVGFNYSGTQEGFSASGVFLNRPSNAEDYLGDQYSLMSVIIHEVGHDLHECTDCKNGIPHSGNSHSREHSIFIGSIKNELENNGISTNFDVDDGDYSNNVSIFGVHTEKTNHMNPVDQAEFDHWKQTYEKIQQAINEGDYKTAMQLMASIPPDATIEFSVNDPQFGDTTTVSYNARELITQELLLQADSDDWLNTDKGEAKTADEKHHLANFFNYMIAIDSSYQTTLNNAAAALHMDLDVELPGDHENAHKKERGADVIDEIISQELADYMKRAQEREALIMDFATQMKHAIYPAFI